MDKRIILFFLLLILLAGRLSPAEAKKNHKSAPLFDLTLFLAPPPAQDSNQAKAELAEILQYQKSRTPLMVADAQADAEETGFSFADVLGGDFTAEKLPLTAA